MKILTTLSLGLLLSTNGFAADKLNQACAVLTLKDSSVLEESLGVYNDTYTDQGAGRIEIEVDASSNGSTVELGDDFYAANEDEIKLKENAELSDVTITTEHEIFKLKIFKKSSLGIILHKDKNQRKFKVIAELDCNDYKSNLKAMRKADAYSIKGKKLSQLPKKFQSKLPEYDIGFEQGDGYYDVQKQTWHPVYKNSKLQGYILVSELSYTEGEDTTVEDYFAPTGLRLSTPGL